MKLDKETIKRIAEEVGMIFYNDTSNYWDATEKQLQEFADKIIEEWDNDEDDFDPIGERNANERYGFTAYGKREDWE
jgi:hypothetical protein